MKLSIVATLYQSANYIHEFYERASSAAQLLTGDDYEIILVNDGSPDCSLELAVNLTKNDPRVTVVDLSRNFGHFKAMMTGLAHSKGEQVFLIDSDLEEQPEWLVAFAQHMEQYPCDVVYGVQEHRKGNWFERWAGQCYYRLFKFLTGLAIPANLVTARLMSRRYVDALLRHNEREIEIAGLWLITGFEQHSYVVKKHDSSPTTYTFRHKLAIVVAAITSFSSVPLIGIFYIGALIFLTSLCYITYLITHRFFLAVPVDGWTSLMASVWLLGGMIISFVGIIGIYLSKIFIEVKQRPYTIVRHVYNESS